jgi:hypothetical protein
MSEKRQAANATVRNLFDTGKVREEANRPLAQAYNAASSPNLRHRVH